MFREAKIVLPVGNVDRAVAFYTEVLGLTLRIRHGDQWAEVEAPGLTVALHPAHGPGPPVPPRGFSIGFQVADLRAAVAALQDRGVTFDRFAEGFVPQAHFRDPDGTPLYLAEVREEPRAPAEGGRKA